MCWKKQSPYLLEGRLPDVIAAITAMGNYRYYKLDFDVWAERIDNSRRSGRYWGEVFEEHPEFFRIDPKTQKASLVWRRQLPRRFDPKKGSEISGTEYYSMSKVDKDRHSRRPLEASELTSLISTAIELHDRALEQQKATRYWIPILASILSFAGALIGAWIGRSGSF